MDKFLFPVNMVNLQSAKVLVRPEQADSTKGNNVVIGEDKPMSTVYRIALQEGVLERDYDAKRSLEVAVKGSEVGDKLASQTQIRALCQQESHIKQV